MRNIVKGHEPASLTQHRVSAHCDFNNYSAKQELREALVSDQRGLCCYCMGRIEPGSGKMKIEHWHCISHFPKEQLTYHNLLGTCPGGEGQPADKQHCDTQKGDKDLQWNPADLAHDVEVRISYEVDGTIRSDDPVFDGQLNDILNLNLARLKNNRKEVLNAVLVWWKIQKNKLKSPVPQARIQREIQKWLNGTGYLMPYCQIAVWWLSKKL